MVRRVVVLAAVSLAYLGGCTQERAGVIAGKPLARTGDEIMVCGQLFHTGTPVVLWTDPGGYDAYRVERRFVPLDEADWQASKDVLRTPNRYGMRRDHLTDDEIERVRGGGWDLPLLQKVVDQFVLHYDVCGTSRRCFQVLHDRRGLSVHFMLDLDGTIYQTLDCKERAWHATTSNDRSIGIEIANMGAYPVGEPSPLEEWYVRDETGQMRIHVPQDVGSPGFRTPDFVGRPARDEPIVGTINGHELRQYDFTPEQYRSLIHLTAALCNIFPRIKCDFPRDPSGKLIRDKLPDEELENYSGVLGHFHIQENKVDPGPAFQWDRLIREAREVADGSRP